MGIEPIFKVENLGLGRGTPRFPEVTVQFRRGPNAPIHQKIKKRSASVADSGSAAPNERKLVKEKTFFDQFLGESSKLKVRVVHYPSWDSPYFSSNWAEFFERRKYARKWAEADSLPTAARSEAITGELRNLKASILPELRWNGTNRG